MIVAVVALIVSVSMDGLLFGGLGERIQPMATGDGIRNLYSRLAVTASILEFTLKEQTRHGHLQ